MMSDAIRGEIRSCVSNCNPIFLRNLWTCVNGHRFDCIKVSQILPGRLRTVYFSIASYSVIRFVKSVSSVEKVSLSHSSIPSIHVSSCSRMQHQNFSSCVGHVDGGRAVQRRQQIFRATTRHRNLVMVKGCNFSECCTAPSRTKTTMDRALSSATGTSIFLLLR